MKVITLTGGRRTGKSITLLHLYDLLKNDGAKDILQPELCPYADTYDRIFFIEHKGQRIGIVTAGDFALESIWHIAVFTGRGADILVIANSNKTRPIQMINWHGLQHEDVKIINAHETGIVDQILTLL